MHVTIERISLAMPASSRLSDTARPGSAAAQSESSSGTFQ
jgi:hypothetical protein